MEFPFEEIARFDSWREASDAGYPDDQIWSVTEGESEMWEFGVFCYGPAKHYVNLLYFVVTAEKHDGHTYYEDRVPRDDFDWLNDLVEIFNDDQNHQFVITTLYQFICSESRRVQAEIERKREEGRREK